MHRDVTHYAGKRCANLVVRQLFLLRIRLGGGRIQRSLRVLIRLQRLFVGLLGDDAVLVQLFLARQVGLVVLVNGLLLLLGPLLRLNRRNLFQRVDLHYQLSRLHRVARLHQDPGQVAADLRLQRCRAPALDGGDVGVRCRHRAQGNRLDLHWQRLR